MLGADVDLTLPPPCHDDRQNDKMVKIRNLAAFWLLGLSGNYTFVIMLTAAFDILDSEEETPHSVKAPVNTTFISTNASAGRFDCNSLSTGVVVLSGILELIIMVSAPWFADYISYEIRIAMCVATSTFSLLVVALMNKPSFRLVGAFVSSASTGISEFTLVSLMAFYDKNVVSTYSSGTGATFIAPLLYAGLTEAGLTPRKTLLIQLVAPLIMIISYWGILVRVPASGPQCASRRVEENTERLAEYDPFLGEEKEPERRHLTLRERCHHLKHVIKYALPLGLVYFGAYFINHGVIELIYFKGIWLTHEGQYRWFQVLYQVGVFLARSSVNIVSFQRLWIFAVLQLSVVVVMLSAAYFAYMPSIFIDFAIIFSVGLIGGAAYVNTFYQIRQNEDPKYKEFTLGATTVCESCGIALAGAVALPLHGALCSL